MPRTTPLYGLPALAPTDRARDIADIDWSNALKLEQILQDHGQPPLGADLVSLLTRLAKLEGAGLTRLAGSQKIAGNAAVTLTTFARDTASSINDAGFYKSNDGTTTTLGPGVYTITARATLNPRPATAARTFLTINVANSAGLSEAWRQTGGVEDAMEAVAKLTVPAGQIGYVNLTAYQSTATETTWAASLYIERTIAV